MIKRPQSRRAPERLSALKALAWASIPAASGVLLPYLAFSGVLSGGSRLTTHEYLIQLPFLALLMSRPSVVFSAVLAGASLRGRPAWRAAIAPLSIGVASGHAVFQFIFWGPALSQRINSTFFVGFTPLSVFPLPALLLVVGGVVASVLFRAVLVHQRAI